MPYFDRFDICEAYLALEMDWNVGGCLQERVVNRSPPFSVGFQLERMQLKPRYNFKGYESLTENGKAIYNAFLEKHRMCSGCDGACFDYADGRSCDQLCGDCDCEPDEALQGDCAACLEHQARAAGEGKPRCSAEVAKE